MANEVIQLPLKDWKKLEKAIIAYKPKPEMISEDEAAKLLGKRGKPLAPGTIYNLRRAGEIPPSYYTIAVNGKIFYDKDKLIGL